MTPPTTLYHALLRPCVLQILRATGYHATRPATLDALTELTARYLTVLCAAAAQHATDNNAGDESEAALRSPLSVVDVRMALEEVGALGVVERFLEPDAGEQQRNGQHTPHSQAQSQGQTQTQTQEEGQGQAGHDAQEGQDGRPGQPADKRGGEDDARGVEEFAAWFRGARCRAIRDMVNAGMGDGVVGSGPVEGDATSTDYLHALMSKHSKSAEESKYHGTILGKGNDAQGEVYVEGGELPSIHQWAQVMHDSAVVSTNLSASPSRSGSRPPSSGLSSVGDRLGELGEEKDSIMDLS